MRWTRKHAALKTAHFPPRPHRHRGRGDFRRGFGQLDGAAADRTGVRYATWATGGLVVRKQTRSIRVEPEHLRSQHLRCASRTSNESAAGARQRVRLQAQHPLRFVVHCAPRRPPFSSSPQRPAARGTRLHAKHRRRPSASPTTITFHHPRLDGTSRHVRHSTDRSHESTPQPRVHPQRPRRFHSGVRFKQTTTTTTTTTTPCHTFTLVSTKNERNLETEPSRLPFCIPVRARAMPAPSSYLRTAAVVASTMWLLAAPTSASVTAAEEPDLHLDALRRSLLGPDHRNLLDLAACQDEAVALETCVRNTLSVEAKIECSSCMTNALDGALPALAASRFGCDDWSAYMCAPLPACPCAGGCRDQYNEYAGCLLKQLLTEARTPFTCDLNCGETTSTSLSSKTSVSRASLRGGD
jgi:hypothetical protein